MTALPCLLFAMSGFSGLLYEVVWTRRLVLVFGATVYSVSVVLAAFMSGFALGALAGGRMSSRVKDPWRLYGWLELGVAASAALFPCAVGGMLALLERAAPPIGPARFILAFAAILPSTMLMGATFPVLAQHAVFRDPAKEVGALYGANLIGACLGALGGAFVLLAFLGLSGTHWLAVSINAAAGLAALSTAGRGRPAAVEAPCPPGRAAGAMIPAAVFIAGLCGMAFEVVWTRVLVPSFNNSAYGFACVLFVFLLGLGGGSLAAGRIKARSFAALGALLAFGGLYGFVGYGVFELAELLVLRFADTRRAIACPLWLLPLAEALAALGPLALIQGMIFPVAVRLSGASDNVGAGVGRLYFWNTMGGIAGSLLAGFWWIPAYGAQNALMVVVGTGLLSGAAALSAGLARPWSKGLMVLGAAVLWLAGWHWLRLRNVPAELLRQRGGAREAILPDILYYNEDVEASVGALRQATSRYLMINGVRVTGYTNITKMLAHIPLLLHPEPKRVLVICFGMGTTFRSAMRHPVKVDVADLVPSVFEAFHFFYPDAGRWAADGRARELVNDGRNHLLQDREGYDVVAVDPSPPLYAAGTVNLYSKDFYALAGRRLKPGGILAVWLPEYPESELKMLMRSFAAAWPHSQFWRGSSGGDGFVMLGSGSPIELDRARVESRLRRPEIRRDMLEFNREFETQDAFWRLYMGPGERYVDYLKDAREVTDDFPWIEYPYFRSLKPDYLTYPAVFSWPPQPLPWMRGKARG